MIGELKPCPFCGGKPRIVDHRTVWTVECMQCTGSVMGERAPEPDGSETDTYWDDIRDSAIDRWNRREGE